MSLLITKIIHTVFSDDSSKLGRWRGPEGCDLSRLAPVRIEVATGKRAGACSPQKVRNKFNEER